VCICRVCWSLAQVNPTQCEAVAMVCAQVMGNHVAITVGGCSGILELNTYKPVLIANLLHSATILGNVAQSFATKCVSGITANEKRLEELMQASLMLATALTPHVGYELATKVAKKAHAEGTTLLQAGGPEGLQCFTEQQFKDWVKPEEMVGPTTKKPSP